MRYCNACHGVTIFGRPLYCNFCGSSYGVRVCPLRHINPRSAMVCSRCGSHDLSKPAPQIPRRVRILIAFLRAWVLGLLVLLSVLVAAGLLNLLTAGFDIPARTVVAVVSLAIAWPSFLFVSWILSEALS